MRAKREPKVDKNLQKTRSGKLLIFGSIFPNFVSIFLEFSGSLFHPNLPSVRKVTCRKTNKKGKESKKEGKVAMQDRTECMNQAKHARRGRGAGRGGFSCLRQYIRPGPAEKGFCENLRLMGRMRQFATFCSLDVQKYQK